MASPATSPATGTWIVRFGEIEAERKQRNMKIVDVASVLTEAVQKVEVACLADQEMYSSFSFLNDPEHPGIVACFAVCSDDVAQKLRRELDRFAEKFFAKHGKRITSSLDSLH